MHEIKSGDENREQTERGTQINCNGNWEREVERYVKLWRWWREDRGSEGEWIKGGREKKGRNTQRKGDRERAQGILSTHMFRLIISLMIIALSLSLSKSVWVSYSLTVCVRILCVCVSIFLFSWITSFLHLSIPIYPFLLYYFPSFFHLLTLSARPA